MAKKIIGIKVFTRSGQSLGKVSDCEINTVNQAIVNYHVGGDFLGLLNEPLVINTSQVIDIEEDKIIVEDAVASEKAVKQKATAEYSPLPE